MPGFNLTYEAVGQCPRDHQLITESGGYISDGVGNYGANYLCKWWLAPPSATFIVIYFDLFDVDTSGDFFGIEQCQSLSDLQDSRGFESSQCQVLAGSEVAGFASEGAVKIKTTTGFIRIVFQSNGDSKLGSGFEMRYVVTSSPATPFSSFGCTCLVPSWGTILPARRGVFILSEGDIPANTATTSRNFTFMTSVNVISPAFALAKGGELITVEGFGFDLLRRDQYYCIFERTGYNPHEEMNDVVEVLNVNRATCRTPAWVAGRGSTLVYLDYAVQKNFSVALSLHLYRLMVLHFPDKHICAWRIEDQCYRVWI